MLRISMVDNREGQPKLNRQIKSNPRDPLKVGKMSDLGLHCAPSFHDMFLKLLLAKREVRA
jgi:hypothetical protein